MARYSRTKSSSCLPDTLYEAYITVRTIINSPPMSFLTSVYFVFIWAIRFYTFFCSAGKLLKAGSYSVLFLKLPKLDTKYSWNNKNVLLSCRVSNQRTWLYRILPSARYAKISIQNLYRNSIFLNN
jgi:hypothetical protein